MRLPHRCVIQKRTAGAADDYYETPPTWADDQTDVHCRFYDAVEDPSVAVGGETAKGIPRVMLPATVTIAKHDYRITTTQAGYAGAYQIEALTTRSNGPGDVHHITADLKAVIS